MVLISPPTGVERVTRLDAALAASAERHGRLCPRQVLGVRIGLAAMDAFGFSVGAAGRCLLAFAETDGCFLDGVEAATGCSAGHRTLWVYDYGKVAGVFVDIVTGRALRIAPRKDVRERAPEYAPDESRRYYAQLSGYQLMPDEVLLSITTVALRDDLAEFLGQAGIRVNCSECGEEVMNRREAIRNNTPLCRSCADGAYFDVLDDH